VSEQCTECNIHKYLNSPSQNSVRNSFFFLLILLLFLSLLVIIGFCGTVGFFFVSVKNSRKITFCHRKIVFNYVLNIICPYYLILLNVVPIYINNLLYIFISNCIQVTYKYYCYFLHFFIFIHIAGMI